jgi:hypothetical protein
VAGFAALPKPKAAATNAQNRLRPATVLRHSAKKAHANTLRIMCYQSGSDPFRITENRVARPRCRRRAMNSCRQESGSVNDSQVPAFCVCAVPPRTVPGGAVPSNRKVKRWPTLALIADPLTFLPNRNEICHRSDWPQKISSLLFDRLRKPGMELPR